ncbi:TPA: hypothetical protein NEG48_003728 [Elizabethkingia anophelis]|nr:hypothetical protein [Elizabethkingia anophelis]
MIQKPKAGLLFLACSVLIMSCRSTDTSISNNNSNNLDSNVKINLVGLEYGDEMPTTIASLNRQNTNSTTINKTEVILTDGDILTATLIQGKTSLSNTQSAINPIAATVMTQLTPGVKYKVAVYDNANNYVTEKDFTYGTADPGFKLDGDRKYTFVAYSINTTTLPIINNAGTLSTAKLSGVNSDLMYFKKTMTVSGNGVNNLDVVLKHLFSQITTKIDARQVGNISAISTAQITPTNNSADLSFNTDAITYNGLFSGGASVVFPTLNQQSVTSTPTLVISDNTTSGVLNIGTLTIDGIPKSNITMNNLKVTPGVKYNLNLRVGPCRQDVTVSDFNVSNGSSQVFNVPVNSDLGLIIDFYGLDSSFNININGKLLTTKEIQFDTSQSPNIRFQDGSQYGVGGLSQIWDFTGTLKSPVIRVIINKNGTASLYGIKNNNGILYPLTLFNSTSFNAFVWNTAAANTVTLTQSVMGPTRMLGKALGKETVLCTP